MVHRDIKPANLFLCRLGLEFDFVKVLDFGLVQTRKVDSPTAVTEALITVQQLIGTPAYMAPEQARGQAVGPMTDLYAMGVVTFEMVTGRLPFIGTSPVDLLMKHVDARPPRPSEFVPDLPPALDAFILQMLTKDPEARPSSADALRQQLHRLRRTMVRPTRVQTSAGAAGANGAAAPARVPTPAPSPATAPVPTAASPESAIEISVPAPAPTPHAEALEQPPEHATAPNAAIKGDDAASSRSTTQVPLPPPEITPAEARAAGLRPHSRRIVPIALAAAALLAAIGILLFRDRGTDTTDVEPPATVTQPAPATPPGQGAASTQVPAPTPTPTPAPPPVTPPPTPPAPDTPVATPDATATPAPKPKPPRNSGSRSSQKEVLMTNVALLERDMNGLIRSGQIKNPEAARNMFARIRDGAEAANSAEDRRNVTDLINLFEKTYLKR
jgi:serine/threonine-protein kinase